MTRVHFDIETRGTVNLPASGQYVYALDRNTEIILSAWAIDDGPVQIWYMLTDPMPAELYDAFMDPDAVLCAHNSAFERILMTLAGPRAPNIPSEVIAAVKPRERWNCTMSRVAALGLPRALDRASKALQLSISKDQDGAKLMMKMCRPRSLDSESRPVWWCEDWMFKRLGTYCAVDVETERAIDDSVPELSDSERAIWLLTERMNDRGAPVDTEFLKALILMIDDATVLLNKKIALATDGTVGKVSNAGAITRWLKFMGMENPLADVEKFSVGKAAINAWMEDETLDPLVREVLILRREGGKSSTAKYRKILERLNYDHRIRGALMYCGAAATSRWSSGGAQLQNLPRGGSVKDLHGAIAAVLERQDAETIETQFGPPLVVASELLRPVFMAPPGYWIVRGDYSQIELRVNAWVSGETKVLDAFRAYDRKEGPDIYLVAAGDITGRDPKTISKDDPVRQQGKVLELACGFAGGKGALLAMAKLYNITLTEEKAQELVSKWRVSRPNIKNMWSTLENASMACMQSDVGHRFDAGRYVSFRRTNRVLAMRLSSGRNLMYWYPRIESLKMPWTDDQGNEVWKNGITYTAESSVTRAWQRFPLSRMILIENPVQAIARDLMADALLKMDTAGFNPFMTVHDEALCLMSKKDYPEAKDAAAAVKGIMEILPKWAEGLPVAADASAHERYIKG